MTPKQQTLYALMENLGYSYGCIQTTMLALGQSRGDLDEMILFVEDYQPTEKELIAKLSELLSH